MLASRARSELAAALPAARAAQLLRSVVVRERRATFSLAPGQPPRPDTKTAVRGLLLAGDWTDTGLPATIEGAVVSGHRAARWHGREPVADGRSWTSREPRAEAEGRPMTSIVVHYQEIALKGKNRPWFIARLVNNIRHATSDLDIRAVRPLVGRLEMVLGPAATYEQVRERLLRVFGIANFSSAARAPLDIEAIAAAILRDLGDARTRGRSA